MSQINIGGLTIDKFYLGNSSDIKIYLGDVKVWPEDVLKYKLVAKYGDVTEYTVACDGSGELTQSEVNGLGSITAMTDAVIDACSSGSFKVGEKAFISATSLTSVTLNEGVTELGNASFRGTSNLRKITFPSTLKVLEGSAFRQSGIREISGIPTGVTYLGSGVFADMTSLTAATIPSSVTGSSTNVFLRDTALKEVHFEGRTAPALGADAFTNCTALMKIVIPDCDCYNSYAAQSQFSGKTNIIYGEDGVKCKKETYNYAFKRVSRGGSAYTVACNSTSSNTISRTNATKGLSNAQISGKTQTQTPVSVVFGDCCHTIDGGACSGWTYLTSVTISDNVTTLNGNSIFENTPRLSHLEIGSGITSMTKARIFFDTGVSASTKPDLNLEANIGLSVANNVFYYSYFNNVIFPKNCTLGSSSFGYCSASTMSFGSGTKILDGNANNSTFYNCRISIIDLNGVTEIGKYAFYKASGFKSITIPSTVTEFNESAFVGNSSLRSVTIDYASNATLGSYQFQSSPITSLTIGSNPTKIGNSMFYGCNKLTSLVIPSNISSIGNSAFNKCSGLTSVTIPNSVISIGDGAFEDCSGLTSITVEATTPPTIGYYVFDGTNNCPIYVPDDSVSEYKTASKWSEYDSRIKPISSK